MTGEQLRTALKATPFRPFRLHLADQRTRGIHIGHRAAARGLGHPGQHAVRDDEVEVAGWRPGREVADLEIDVGQAEPGGRSPCRLDGRCREIDAEEARAGK